MKPNTKEHDRYTKLQILKATLKKDGKNKTKKSKYLYGVPFIIINQQKPID